MNLKWLEWAQQLQAIAQNGFTYCNNTYDLEPYRQIRQIARLFEHYYHPEWQTDFD